MGRRSDHSRDEIREMAIAAAAEIVEKEGFQSLTARKVAGRIGYTVGTLYHVFRNFDDLVMHLNAQTIDEMARIYLIDDGVRLRRQSNSVDRIGRLQLEIEAESTCDRVAHLPELDPLLVDATLFQRIEIPTDPGIDIHALHINETHADIVIGAYRID